MDKIHEAMISLRDFLQAQALTPESLRLNYAMACKEATGFSILITGEFSRGKTSLLNALIGEDILATSLLRLPIINILKGGEIRAGKVFLSGVESEVAISDLTKIQDATRVELTWDSNFLQHGIQLMEYPSMGEPPQLNAFEKAVAEADLIVVVVAADSLYSNVEANVIEDTIKANGHQRLLFVVNFWDRVVAKDREEVKQAALIRLPVNEDRIFFVSTFEALEGNTQAQAVIETIKQALQNAADNRQDIKTQRLFQVAQLCINHAEKSLANTTEQDNQKQRESEQICTLINKYLGEIKETRNEIQDDLSELRNGTRDVVEAKISNLIKELRFSVRGWIEENTDDNPAGHLNKQLRLAIDTFMANDFKPYLRKRSEEQQELLKNGAARYQRNLEQLYNLLPENQSTLQLGEKDGILNSSPDGINIAVSDSGIKRSQPRFDYNKMFEVPESMIVLAVTAVGSVIFRQFAIFIAPAGLFLSGFLSTLRSKSKSYNAGDIATLEQQVTDQAARMESEIMNETLTEMDKIHDTVSEMLSTTTKTADQDAKAYILQLQGNNQLNNNIFSELSKIKESLGL